MFGRLNYSSKPHKFFPSRNYGQILMNHATLQLQSNLRERDTTSFYEYLRLIADNRRLIACCTVLAVLLGLAYTIIITPIYRANILVKVDAGSDRGRTVGATNQAETNIDLKSAVAAEMEVLRSRSVVSRAIDEGKFFIHVQPRYFPGIGRWIASRNSSLSSPGLFGYGGHVWGNERAVVTQFNVPEKLEGRRFILTVGEDGGFALSNEENMLIAKGKAGVPLKQTLGEGTLELTVEQLNAKPRAQFVLVRSNRQDTIEQLQNSLNISEKGKQSGIIEVTLDGTDRAATAHILDGISREYIRQNAHQHSAEAERTLAFLNTQLPQLKQELEQSEAKYNSLRNAKGTVDLGEEAKNVLQQSVYAQTKLVELRQRKEELLTRYEEEHPAVKAVNQQMRELRQELTGVDNKIKRLPEVEQNVLRLNRDVHVNTALYTALLSTAQQLRVTSASKVGTVNLLDTAVTMRNAIRPKPGLVLAISGALGILGGILVALFRKHFYCRINAPYDIEKLLGIPVAANIPHSALPQRLRVQGRSKIPMLPLDSSSSDITAEGLRRFRTQLQFAMLEARNNIVMITGPTTGVGKSFVSANFAVVLASIGKRVLLLDADLRSGHLHDYFGVDRKNGLSEILRGMVMPNHVIHNEAAENVDFISAGSLTSKPAELLACENFSKLLQMLSGRYDYILIDTAPILEVSDALVVAPHAGAIFNIVRSGKSTAHEAEEAAKCLTQAGHVVSGIVLNDSKRDYARYGYGAYG